MRLKLQDHMRTVFPWPAGGPDALCVSQFDHSQFDSLDQLTKVLLS